MLLEVERAFNLPMSGISDIIIDMFNSFLPDEMEQNIATKITTKNFMITALKARTLCTATGDFEYLM